MTDNAWAYRHSLREVVARLSACQVFIKPHCPRQNGRVEPLNPTLTTEWAYRQAFTSNDQPIALAGSSSTTTLDAATPPSPGPHPSAVRHEPPGRVQLAADRLIHSSRSEVPSSRVAQAWAAVVDTQRGAAIRAPCGGRPGPLR
jgi:hypothetical protein